ncbi:hypothetical protein AAC387_Pa12g1240 [Persea americana]
MGREVFTPDSVLPASVPLREEEAGQSNLHQERHIFLHDANGPAYPGRSVIGGNLEIGKITGHIRILPSEEVDVLEFPSMQPHTNDASYEELLALEERIGNSCQQSSERQETQFKPISLILVAVDIGSCFWVSGIWELEEDPEAEFGCFPSLGSQFDTPALCHMTDQRWQVQHLIYRDVHFMKP